MTAEEFTKTYQPWLATAAFIVSLWYGGVQYLELRREQTVDRVFDMSKEYRATFLDADLKFSDAWTDYYQASVRTLSNVDVLKQYPKLVKTFLENPDTRTAYEKLGIFYNSVGECVRAKLCDFDSANTIFGKDILTYYHNMYPDLENVSKHGYEADGILYFIARSKVHH